MRRSILALTALATLSACKDDKDDGGGETDPDADADGDGYSTNDGDCDDGDASVNPGAAEVCDELDNNCDGNVDMDDPLITGWGTWYVDADGDGYGDEGRTSDGCTQPDGTSDNALDCDDVDDDVHPDADEFCDGIDNDCDGLTDSDDDGVLGEPTWYDDADLDGFGDPETATEACDQPGVMISDGSDCDDTDATVFPGATETCADGVDQDCDGWDGPPVLDETQGLECAQGIALGDAGAGLGSMLALPGDTDHDGETDLLVGSEAGEAWLMTGTVGVDAPDPEATARFSGSWTALGGGDFDDELLDDVVLAASADDRAPTAAAGAYVFFGPLTGTMDASAAGAAILGTEYGNMTGAAVSGGDFDGDGVADVLLGAPGVTSISDRSGSVYLMAGPVTSTTAVSAAMATYSGTRGAWETGAAVIAAGDVDGNGYDDVVAGAPRDGTAGDAAGAVFVLSGPVTAGEWPDPLRLPGEEAGDGAGAALAPLRDIDNDGYSDFAVGAPDNDAAGSAAGAVYLVYGPVSLLTELSGARAVITGSEQGDNLGASISYADDMDADGEEDLVLGAPREDWNPGPGGAWLVYGPVSGAVSVRDVGIELLGEDDGDRAGTAVLGGFDQDRDLVPDLLVGAPGRDGGAGAVYLLIGG